MTLDTVIWRHTNKKLLAEKMHRELANTIQLLERGIEESNRPEDRKLATNYLAALAPVLASAVIGDDILPRLKDIERLFGHTWLIDQTPFENAFSSWQKFRNEYERFALGGMTVNERLYALGILDEYDRAVTEGNIEALENILRQARVDDDSIRKIIDNQTKNG